MQFGKLGAFHSVSRITGPHHNILLISFESADRGEIFDPRIEALPPVGECRHEVLDPMKILREVLVGVKEANAKFQTEFRVDGVQYVENDTRPESAYRHMAFKLVEHLATAQTALQ